MLLFSHFEAVRFTVAACVMKIWRITIKARRAAIVQSNSIDSRPILDLNPKETHGYFG